MKLIELGVEEIARYGFTHKAVISFAEGDFTAAALTQTYNVGPAIGVNDVVDNAALRVVTAFAGGAVATATLSFGFTGTVAGFIAATNVFTGAVLGTTAGAGASLANAPGASFAAASQLVAVLTTTVANVNALTAGEAHIYFRRKRTSLI